MAEIRHITVLGATGSIGQSSLALVRQHPERFAVRALVAGKDFQALAALAHEFKPEIIGIHETTNLAQLKDLIGTLNCQVVAGEAACSDIATIPVDLVIAGISGLAGLPSVFAAVNAGQTVAIANKESLVSAGAVVTRRAIEAGAHILPIDSEHNAVFQCWNGWKGHQSSDTANARTAELSHICLTASGGPFLTLPLGEFSAITPAAAVKHPNWEMGKKISIDSATMMNKGLEVIEARWLFDLVHDKIDVLVHPQQAIHGLVHFRDGSVIAQMGGADMRIPISYAMAWPERLDWQPEPFDLAAMGNLTFQNVDQDRFPCYYLARHALAAGGNAPAVLNAANEVAVESFLAGNISFPDIARVVDACLSLGLDGDLTTIEAVFAIDQRARGEARQIVAAR
ncbi:MAG: 1-deoxy-D-xylulose-5-phosphate reductoisomerase [Alphaproteobacteria bacterium]|jgi:1-deoxy-D-xylulose-5-phosphate reductoisomerase|nr:1-deoxy-D-xylulose-5-phosphate reductoisomerase [Alphaproteobacteria bacterium]NDG36114.1 1-deoxy-D-xylulose-5-phosphate reductoisomerase [Alphaproteobacteria bacterium]